MTDEERARLARIICDRMMARPKPEVECDPDCGSVCIAEEVLEVVDALLAEVRASARAEALEEAARHVERPRGRSKGETYAARLIRALAQAAPAPPDTKKGPPSDEA